MDKERMAQQIIRGCSGKRCCQMQKSPSQNLCKPP